MLGRQIPESAAWSGHGSIKFVPHVASCQSLRNRTAHLLSSLLLRTPRGVLGPTCNNNRTQQGHREREALVDWSRDPKTTKPAARPLATITPSSTDKGASGRKGCGWWAGWLACQVNDCYLACGILLFVYGRCSR